MRDQAARLREMVDRNRRGARAIAVASGKGGVGKSVFVVNLALVLARMGYAVLVFDADLGMANVDVLLGLTPRYTLYEVVRGVKKLEDIILVGPYNVKVIPGGSGIVEMANLSPGQLMRLGQDLKRLESQADFILIDTGAGISRTVVNFIKSSSEVVVMFTPEPTAITDAYGLIKVISRLNEQPQIRLVVNRVAGKREGDEFLQRMESVVHQFLRVGTATLGYIVDDRSVEQAVRRQQPFVLQYPGSHAAKNLYSIASSLSGASFHPPVLGGFAEKLLRLFS